MNPKTDPVLASAAIGTRLDPDACHRLVDAALDALVAAAGESRDRGHGTLVTYSRKVFIPLTKLCRDVCHYCTFARTPRHLDAPYLSVDEAVAIAEAGARAGCFEALFTLGDKPELRYRAARDALATLGFDSTIDYLVHVSKAVHDRTGLLPHVNPGVLDAAEVARLREVSVSAGIMLESVSERLCERGGPHFGSPDKHPAVRLDTLRLAGEQSVPFTTGILIGIGETRAERIDALLAIRALHERHGHIQEVIVQNFRAKTGTLMAQAPEPSLDELVWSIAVARLILGPHMNIQAPPNLSPGALAPLVAAGINDWGGVSPVTPDHVNPEAPWPHVDQLAEQTLASGKRLAARLAIYPRYLEDPQRWLAPSMRASVLASSDGQGLARTDAWSPGDPEAPTPEPLQAGGARCAGAELDTIIERARAGETLAEPEVVALFEARGADAERVCEAADALRREVNGDAVTYVVNRNINYTNVCYFKCRFCAFSKGKLSANLRGEPYDLDHEEIARRTREAWARGATEVCLQGGIHPDYTGATYLEICRTVKSAAPDIHVHAFSPLEIWQGAKTLGRPVEEFLAELVATGLGSLPGTAAEILDDEVRATLCPDKINTAEWLEVMETAHGIGLGSTATIMFGHVDGYRHWARHILRVRALQMRTGGFTEFVPLPYVHMESPMYLRGGARRGPTYRESVLMHAVARLALHPHVENIQTSWVKMGPQGTAKCLSAGANDLGGTLMNESITRAAGAGFGEEMAPATLEELVRSLGRTPRQRSTLYGTPAPAQVAASFEAGELTEVVNRRARRYERRASALVRSGTA